MDEQGWATLLTNLDRIDAVAAEHGVRAVLHPHVGTMIENGEEVQRVLGGSSTLRGLALTPDPPTLDIRGPLALQDLATALQLAGRLGVLKNGDIAYIEKTPDLVPGTSFPNRARLPVHATALGKALLAYAPAVVVQRFAAGGLARFTEYTPTSSSELDRAVVHARLHGFATSDRELNLDVRSVAAPVLDTGGVATAAIEVQVPDLDPSTLARVTPALILAARTLARELAPITYRFDATPRAGIHPRHSPPEAGRPHGPPALNELTALLGRRVRMCPLTTQVDGEERAAQDERTRDQLPVTKPDGAEY